MVICSHPHAPQGYVKYNGSLIFYSLGNFYFDYDYDYAANYENHSYAVMIELNPSKAPDFEAVHHVTHNKKVRLSDKQVDLKRLCEALKESHEKSHDEMSISAYEKIVRRNLITSASKLPFDGTIKGRLKEIAAKILGRRKKVNKPLTQLHFMRNEAYYYAARHALEVKAKNL